MSDRRKKSVSNLSSLYTVVMGIALSIGISRVVGATDGIASVSMALILLFMAFFVTLFPFYHGAMRHIDDAYIECENPTDKDLILLFDLFLLVLHGIAFVILALLLDYPSQFAWVLLVVLGIDVIWGIFTHFTAPTGDGEWKWALINGVTVLLGAGLLITFDIYLGEFAYPDKLAFWIFVVATIRSICDYFFCRDFYFP